MAEQQTLREKIHLKIQKILLTAELERRKLEEYKVESIFLIFPKLSEKNIELIDLGFDSILNKNNSHEIAEKYGITIDEFLKVRKATLKLMSIKEIDMFINNNYNKNDNKFIYFDLRCFLYKILFRNPVSKLIFKITKLIVYNINLLLSKVLNLLSLVIENIPCLIKNNFIFFSRYSISSSFLFLILISYINYLDKPYSSSVISFINGEITIIDFIINNQTAFFFNLIVIIRFVLFAFMTKNKYWRDLNQKNILTKKYVIYIVLSAIMFGNFYHYFFFNWMSFFLVLFFCGEIYKQRVKDNPSTEWNETMSFLGFIFILYIIQSISCYSIKYHVNEIYSLIATPLSMFIISICCISFFTKIYRSIKSKKSFISNDNKKKDNIIDGLTLSLQNIFGFGIDKNFIHNKLQNIILENEFHKGINNSMNSFLDELRNKIQPIQTSVDQLITFRHESQNILINMDYKTGELKNKITSDTVFRIDEYVESISAYINDLKDKINESKRINSFKEPEPELLSVKELIESCMNSGEVEAMILHNNIQVYYNIEEDKDSIFIDRSHGKMCLGNIIRNSLRAIDQRIADAIFDTGDYKPHIIFSTEIANGKTIIKISDNGCGMPEHISKKLYREKISTQLGDNHGSGGMIVAYLLKLNNCSITVVDSSEAGTVQVITGPYSAEVVN